MLALPAGVVFDLDGTLADNLGFHGEAFARFGREHGLAPPSGTRWVKMMGKRNSDVFELLFGRRLDREEFERFEAEKEALYREISAGRLRPVAGLEALLAALERHGIPAAVATSAPEANVVHTLRELALAERLTCVVRSDEVARGKPHPDVFEAAARALGVDPGRCLAFEDAPAGIASARAAGMTCVALATTLPGEELAACRPPPHAIAADYREFLAGPGAALAGGSGWEEHA